MSALAADFTVGVSLGQSDYSMEYSYPYQNSQDIPSTRAYSEEIDFDYSDVSINYIPETGATISLKIGGLEEITDYVPLAEQSTAVRDEISLSFSKNYDESYGNSDIFFGYYQSETSKTEDYRPFISGYNISENFDTSIDSEGFFFGLNYSTMTDNNLIWFMRAAFQFGWTDFYDSYSYNVSLVSSPEISTSGGSAFNRELFGTAIALGLGLYLPVIDNVGLTFSVETKTYDYDDEDEYHFDGVTTLSEEQTSIIIGLVTNF